MRVSPWPVRPFNFFALTLLLSWAIWVPLALSHFGIGLRIPDTTSGAVRLLGVLMPAGSALILSARAGGAAAVKHLLSGLLIWRVPWRWWAAAVLVQPVLLVLAAVIYNAAGGATPVQWLPPAPVATWLATIFFLALATLGEEVGWRGLALPELQRTRTPMAATVILGTFWAAWHIPFWLLMDTYTSFGVPYLILNFLFVLPGTAYITWFFNHGGSSVLLAVAFHLSFNVVNTAWLPTTMQPGAFAVLVAFEWVIAALVSRHLECEPAKTARPVLS